MQLCQLCDKHTWNKTECIDADCKQERFMLAVNLKQVKHGNYLLEQEKIAMDNKYNKDLFKVIQKYPVLQNNFRGFNFRKCLACNKKYLPKQERQQTCSKICGLANQAIFKYSKKNLSKNVNKEYKIKILKKYGII